MLNSLMNLEYKCSVKHNTERELYFITLFTEKNKTAFIPEMVGPLLEMTLIPETGETLVNLWCVVYQKRYGM